MFKGIRLKIILGFVFAIMVAEISAGLFITLRTVSTYHSSFDAVCKEVFDEEMRKTLTDTANAVTIQPGAEGEEAIVLSEPGPVNAENLKNIMFDTKLFRESSGMRLAILDASGSCMYQNDSGEFYKNSRVTEEALEGNEALSNHFSAKTIEYAIPLKDNNEVRFVIYIRDPMTQQNELVRRIVSLFAILVPASAILMFVIALFFSKSVTYYPDDQVSEFDIPEFDCAFWSIPENIWSASTDGRALLFKPNRPTAPLKGPGEYSIYMRTLYAKSDDIVRISSNGQPNPSFHPGNNGAPYDGNRYRSTIFDLFTYPPFRFAAQVNNEGKYVSSGEDEESVDAIQWEYGKGKPVTVSFDVTSYRNTKRYYGDEPQGTSVDPFGQAFDIYIDAPMLEIDQAAAAARGLTEAKFRPHPTIEGRFIYTVEATRDAERAFWSDGAFIDDTSVANPSQAGERKNLPFKTKRVVSLGEITLSTNEEQILYYDKTFSVTNKSIEGAITFGTEGNQQAMPKDAFVVLQRVSDGARVGSFTIDRDGHFLLRLRSEYTINWDLDEYKVDYTDTAGGGRVYVSNIIKLQSLMTATPTIELMRSE